MATSARAKRRLEYKRQSDKAHTLRQQQAKAKTKNEALERANASLKQRLKKLEERVKELEIIKILYDSTTAGNTVEVDEANGFGGHVLVEQAFDEQDIDEQDAVEQDAVEQDVAEQGAAGQDSDELDIMDQDSDGQEIDQQGFPPHGFQHHDDSASESRASTPEPNIGRRRRPFFSNS